MPHFHALILFIGRSWKITFIIHHHHHHHHPPTTTTTIILTTTTTTYHHLHHLTLSLQSTSVSLDDLCFNVHPCIEKEKNIYKWIFQKNTKKYKKTSVIVNFRQWYKRDENLCLGSDALIMYVITDEREREIRTLRLYRSHCQCVSLCPVLYPEWVVCMWSFPRWPDPHQADGGEKAPRTLKKWGKKKKIWIPRRIFKGKILSFVYVLLFFYVLSIKKSCVYEIYDVFFIYVNFSSSPD